VHGSNSHSGSQCRVMNQDSSYTHAMKMASAPSTINGYQGSN
jgi:hypothetical protein